MLMIGYFEGLDSERGIAWRVGDSLSLRKFLGYALDEQTPDHSTVSRTRRLLWLETHKAVFRWMLKILIEEELVKGQTVSIDATTLEANAALKSIVRRDNGQKYDEYLKQLARAAGIDHKTMRFVAFEGGGDCATALQGGHVQACMNDVGDSQAAIDGGAPLKLLAIFAPERLSGKLAEVPTARSGKARFS